MKMVIIYILFFYSITIDQSGIGNIYDVSMIIPNGFNQGQTQTDNIGVINANTQQTFEFFFYFNFKSC